MSNTMMYVKDIMTTGTKTIDAASTVREAASLMAKEGVGSVVVTRGGKPVGIVTEGDVSRSVGRKLAPDKTPVRSIMGKPLVTTTREARVEEAAKLMASSRIKKLPVVEDDKLIGMVTQTDIIGVSYDLVKSLKEMVSARYRPPDFVP